MREVCYFDVRGVPEVCDAEVFEAEVCDAEVFDTRGV